MCNLKETVNIAIFAYNFPHRKTADFIDQIYTCGFKISVILAADFIDIKSPKSFFSFKSQYPKISPKYIAQKHKIPYYVVEHNGKKTISLLKKHNINLGVISGARIIHKSIIQSIKLGVLNFHPGLLPKIRGLDSVLWSIYNDYPLGVTAHLINDQIDAGYLVYKKQLKIIPEDDIYSLYEKIYQLQLHLIPISLNLILEKKIFKILKLGRYNSKMSYKNQSQLSNKIIMYIQKYASDKYE